MNLRHVADRLRLVGKGLATWVPGVGYAIDPGAGGKTSSAAYCYGVWLKHLTLLWQHGMCSIPRTVLELGPGSSLGTGLAALLSGADRYLALDAVRYADPRRDAVILRELTRLLQSRAPRPEGGWPDYDAQLDAGLFPGHILTEERLCRSLAVDRVARLESALLAAYDETRREPICYRTWKAPPALAEGEVDLVFSHAVLQHAVDLAGVYAQCRRWLRPGGFMSHHVDHSSVGITTAWDGHWQFGERTWRLIRGGRPYFINREPCSTHLRLLRENGFELVGLFRRLRSDVLPRTALAPRWRELSDEDAHTRASFLLARRVESTAG